MADYTHLVDGPSVLLVAHEANYALDETGGRPGLSYTRKQPLEGTFGERLAVAAAALIAAARRLEQDTARMTGGGIVFPGNEIEFAANDRLAAPRGADAESALRNELAAFGGRLFGAADVEVQPVKDPARLGFTVQTAEPPWPRYSAVQGRVTSRELGGLRGAALREQGRCCPALRSRTSRATAMPR